MTRIRRMPEALANQIAAGEVVDRPASIVKELVENSLDAEAHSIFVVIEKSGKDRIRVTDDGTGMTSEEVHLALQRHATSKLFATEDLSRITSLGFRGEALPSIASVSHLILQTRADSEESGTELTLEGGVLVREQGRGLPTGTIIEVRNLFFNVPARRKFLKADVTEASHVAYLLSNFAVSFPKVHFRLEHGKRTVLDTPAVTTRRERLYQIEKSWVEGAIFLEESVGSLSMAAWLSPPAEARGTSQRLHLFVNGRPVKDRILGHAVLEAYRQVSTKSGTPLVYLFIDLPPAKVDVNVHPAKSEIRFVDQQHVHNAIFSMVKNALYEEGRAPEISLGGTGKYSSLPSIGEGPSRASQRVSGFGTLSSTKLSGTEMAEVLLGKPAINEGEMPSFAGFAETPPTPIGQFRDSFILALDAENVWLIDQHAAHERILYEGLVERQHEIEQQLLLTPVPLDLSPSERITMEEEHSKFMAFGYDIEPFGSDGYIVRAVPGSLGGLDPIELIRLALAEREKECRSASVVDAHGRIAARLACHAAIKVNFGLAMEKMQYIVAELWRMRRPTVCPHGRPTTLRIGLEQVERKFGRI